MSVQRLPDCSIWKVSTFPSVSLARAAIGEAIKCYSANRKDNRISLPPAATELSQQIKLHLGDWRDKNMQIFLIRLSQCLLTYNSCIFADI